MRDYQRMAPQKLSDANLESILWNKVPIKLQKEVGRLTEGSLQELFQKLLKAEEIVKERERRNTFSRGSTTREFRQKPTHRAPAQNTNSTPAQREDNRPRLLEPLKTSSAIDVEGKVMLLSLVVLLLIKLV